MINLNGLKFDNLDEIMVVDRNFNIVFCTRTEKATSYLETKENGLIGKNIFEAYPSIHKESSSFTMALIKGEQVTKVNQKFMDSKGKVYCTHNVTFPIIKKGKIIGAVELSKDITTIENVEEPTKESFPNLLHRITSELEKNEGVFFEQIYTLNEEMKNTIERAKILSRSPTPTLIYGETGTGKELFAQAMITYSGIDRDKVVVQNCASVPENLIESILFGTVKGAYTGAETHKGLFEEADGGIFFLDELNSLPYHVQGKLLRVIQDGTFRPIGSNKEKCVNVKIIAAMNIDPEEATERNVLRKDLFYRLNGGIIYLRPLRERKEDIMYLVSHYITESNVAYEKHISGITKRLEAFFYDYPWEGNVRELKHLIESMVSVSSNNVLDINELPAYMYSKVKTRKKSKDEESKDIISVDAQQIPVEIKNISLKNEIEKYEKKIISEMLEQTNGNKTKAAELLDMPRQTLTYKIAKLDIKV